MRRREGGEAPCGAFLGALLDEARQEPTPEIYNSIVAAKGSIDMNVEVKWRGWRCDDGEGGGGVSEVPRRTVGEGGGTRTEIAPYRIASALRP